MKRREKILIDFLDEKLQTEKSFENVKVRLGLNSIEKSEKRSSRIGFNIMKIAAPVMLVILFLSCFFVRTASVRCDGIKAFYKPLYMKKDDYIVNPLGIGYKTDKSCFNIDEVEIDVLIGVVKDPKYYSDNATITITYKANEASDEFISMRVYEIYDFYNNFSYEDKTNKHRFICFKDIRENNIIRIKLDKILFLENEGEIKISVTNHKYIRYAYIFYAKDINNDLIYLSQRSIDDAKRKIELDQK